MMKNCLFLVGLTLSIQVVAAIDPPTAALNPQTGLIEIVDSTPMLGDHEVRHVVHGPEPTVTILSDNAIEDLAPRIAVSPQGNSYLVWWQDAPTARVILRRHDFASGTWSDEFTLSDPGEDSHDPEVIHDGTIAWVAYESDAAGSIGIHLGAIGDEPEPFGTFEVVATTTYTGDTDVQVHFENGRPWATWIDSATDVGWSSFDYGSATWSQPDFDSYALDDVAAARARIREEVLAP